jgi:hypothetical protein
MYEYLLNDFDDMNEEDYQMMMMMIILNLFDFEFVVVVVVVVVEYNCYNYPLKIIYNDIRYFSFKYNTYSYSHSVLFLKNRIDTRIKKQN